MERIRRSIRAVVPDVGETDQLRDAHVHPRRHARSCTSPPGRSTSACLSAPAMDDDLARDVEPLPRRPRTPCGCRWTTSLTTVRSVVAAMLGSAPPARGPSPEPPRNRESRATSRLSRMVPRLGYERGQRPPARPAPSGSPRRPRRPRRSATGWPRSVSQPRSTRCRCSAPTISPGGAPRPRIGRGSRTAAGRPARRASRRAARTPTPRRCRGRSGC